MDVSTPASVQLGSLQVAGTRAPNSNASAGSNAATSENSVQLRSADAQSVTRPENKPGQTTQVQTQAKTATVDARPAVGRIRFEVEDGTRIAKFFDMKDVLIYQVPPEGQIYLIKAKEAASKDQVETSA
jgi:hypothetical protein